MSSFNGRVVELPGVVVDHFVSSNLKQGHFFFLSHCHKGELTLESQMLDRHASNAADICVRHLFVHISIPHLSNLSPTSAHTLYSLV